MLHSIFITITFSPYTLLFLPNRIMHYPSNFHNHLSPGRLVDLPLLDTPIYPNYTSYGFPLHFQLISSSRSESVSTYPATCLHSLPIHPPFSTLQIHLHQFAFNTYMRTIQHISRFLFLPHLSLGSCIAANELR